MINTAIDTAEHVAIDLTNRADDAVEGVRGGIVDLIDGAYDTLHPGDTPGKIPEHFRGADPMLEGAQHDPEAEPDYAFRQQLVVIGGSVATAAGLAAAWKFGGAPLMEVVSDAMRQYGIGVEDELIRGATEHFETEQLRVQTGISPEAVPAPLAEVSSGTVDAGSAADITEQSAAHVTPEKTAVPSETTGVFTRNVVQAPDLQGAAMERITPGITDVQPVPVPGPDAPTSSFTG